MNNILKSLTLLPLTLLVVACGSGGVPTQAPSSDITVALKKSTLSTDKKEMNIDFLLTNNYSSKVDVEVKDFSLNIPDCEIERTHFSDENIKFNKKSNVKVSVDVNFIEECTPSSYELQGVTVLGLEGVLGLDGFFAAALVVGFLAGFLAVVFFAAAFLEVAFFVAVFLATGLVVDFFVVVAFFAATFLAVVFLAGVLAFLAVAFFAAVFLAVVFFAATFLVAIGVVRIGSERDLL